MASGTKTNDRPPYVENAPAIACCLLHSAKIHDVGCDGSRSIRGRGNRMRRVRHARLAPHRAAQSISPGQSLFDGSGVVLASEELIDASFWERARRRSQDTVRKKESIRRGGAVKRILAILLGIRCVHNRRIIAGIADGKTFCGIAGITRERLLCANRIRGRLTGLIET